MPFRSYTRRLALGLAGAIVLLALLGWLVFEPIPDLFAPVEGLSPEARAKARNDVRTAALQLLGGTVLALGAYFTWQNVLTNREGRRIEREGQITERFTRAIDQLGNKEPDVRLGGIYGLERIARDSQDDHGPVMEVLTAYVREHAPWSPSSEEPVPSEGESAASNTPRATEDTSRRPTTPTTDVQAALTVIGRRELDHEKGAYRHLDLALTDLRGADLRKARLEGARLEGANLQGANLQGANLARANLQGANLEGARLQGARLEEANLQGANLEGARLQGANLARANLARARLEEANLQEANLQEANLQGARLEGARLVRARLDGARLARANLEGASLVRANLDGASLVGARLVRANLEGASLVRANLEGARYNSETTRPEGFDLEAAGSKIE